MDNRGHASIFVSAVDDSPSAAHEGWTWPEREGNNESPRLTGAQFPIRRLWPTAVMMVADDAVQHDEDTYKISCED
jgi:hypothetical protein